MNPNINRFVGADMYVAAAANLDLQLDPLTGNRYLYAGVNPNFIDDGHGLGCPKFMKKFCKKVRHQAASAAKTVGAAATSAGNAVAGAAKATVQTAAKAATATGEWVSENKQAIVHYAVGIGVGVVAGLGAAAVCAGTAGFGCVVAAGALIGAANGIPAHMLAATFLHERITGRKVAEWGLQSAEGGAMAGLFQGAFGRSLSARVLLGTKAGYPGLSNFLRQGWFPD
jgi:hypothetical protein